MAATTWKTFLNRCLVTLGETQIATATSTLTDEYHVLLNEMANQIKEEIEDKTNWRVLRTEYPVTVAANATSTAITNATERSRLAREHESENMQLVPLVFDQTDSNDYRRLVEIGLVEINRLLETEEDTGYSEIEYFAIDHTGADEISLVTYPPCSTERTISVTMYTPQDFFAVSDLSTNILIPLRPLLQGTLWFAFEERGEELGPNSRFSEAKYLEALNDAVARDAAEQGNTQLVPV